MPVIAEAADASCSPRRLLDRRALRKAGVVIPALMLALSACAQFTRLKPDEQMVFYPTLGQRAPAGGAWRLEIQGCIYEPENRRITLAALREALELKHVAMTSEEEARFQERARLFLVDNQRGRRVVVRVGEREFGLGKTAPNGHFAGTARLDENALALGVSPPDGARVVVTAVLDPKDGRRFAGGIWLLDDSGVSVVSDIDDTIKVTDVRDRRAALRNTFLREFQPVPGMMELYQGLARSNRAQFHYVSASPWQLYPSLAEFVRSSGFPAGTFHLKTVRLKDRSVFNLFTDPEKYKTGVIESLLMRFPNRQFIFVGDSGERDPEIYAALARRHPSQCARILIRNVTGEPADAARYSTLFRGLSPSLWTVFRSPAEVVRTGPRP